MSWLDPSEYNPSDICPICHEEYGTTTGIYKTDCNHIFHNDCLYEYCKLKAQIECPICRSDLENACDDVFAFKRFALGSPSGEPLFNGNQHIQDIYNKNEPPPRGGKINKRKNKTKRIKKTKRRGAKNRRIRTKRRERR